MNRGAPLLLVLFVGMVMAVDIERVWRRVEEAHSELKHWDNDRDSADRHCSAIKNPKQKVRGVVLTEESKHHSPSFSHGYARD